MHGSLGIGTIIKPLNSPSGLLNGAERKANRAQPFVSMRLCERNSFYSSDDSLT